MTRETFRRCRSDSAFTMVEIALALGIIAFALVAIIGVLPAGLKVQRENREDTVVNQDASFLMEAIRSGSKGVDDLTNYVESITVTRGGAQLIYTNNQINPGAFLPLTNGFHIVSLLSTPKIDDPVNFPNRVTTVTARMRSLSGNALDKSHQMNDFAFRYEVRVELVGCTNLPPIAYNNSPLSNRLYSVNLSQNLYDLRLLMRWPLFQKGSGWAVGRYRRTYRTLVSGELLPVYTNQTPYLYILEPTRFVSAH